MHSELLADLYERQEDLDPSTFETRASTILVGLGFRSSATDSEGIYHTTYILHVMRTHYEQLQQLYLT